MNMKLYNGIVTLSMVPLAFVAGNDWRSKLMWAKQYFGISQVVKWDGLLWNWRGSQFDDGLGLLLHEPEVARLVTSLFKDRGVFLDVGANVGGYSLRAAKAGMEVYAWEPNPVIYENLVTNVRLNALFSHITTYPLALGEKNGQAHLVEKGPESKIGDEGLSVAMQRLDDYHFDHHVDLIKIDVEGYEEKIIRGGMNLIADHKPKLVIEIHAMTLGEHISDLIRPFYKPLWVLPNRKDSTGNNYWMVAEI